MSHGPESHHEQAPIVLDEPERIPIHGPHDPTQNNTIINQKTFTTTHIDFLDHYYIVKNSSMAEAQARIISEQARTNRLRAMYKTRNSVDGDAQENDLYRLNSIGIPIRPAASSDAFVNTLVSEGIINEDDKLKEGAAGAFITYGMSDTGKNEMAAISERSTSIVLSNQARDKALAEGKSIEEAQTIGAKVYLEQEQFKKEYGLGTSSQPEITSIKSEQTPTIPVDDEVVTAELIEDDELVPPTRRHGGEIIDAEIVDGDNESDSDKDSSKTESETVANPTTKEKSDLKERNEQRAEAAKKLIKKIGRNARISLKVIRKTGILLPHAKEHEAKDAVEELLMRADLALDKMTTSALDKIDQTKINTYHAAVDLFHEQRHNIASYWVNRYQLHYDTKLGERRTKWRAKYDRNLEEDEQVNQIVRDIRAYLFSKHPDKPEKYA